jgi:hypothetical protein
MAKGRNDEAGRVDRWTVAGLVLLLMPLATMAHEIGGHVSLCLAVGGTPTEIGAYYVNCAGTSDWSGRIVALAGTGMDILVAAICYGLWTRAKGDLLRLILWMLFVVKAMTAAGYPAFSGVVGIGDWGVAEGGGLYPVASPWLWRIAMTAIGIGAYVLVIQLAIRTLRAMLGGGEQAWHSQRTIALTLYLVNGAIAIVVGLFNPVGFFILLVSAIASSFGGTAGLWNVAYAARQPGEAAPFAIARNWPVIIAGVAVTLAFAIVLGPTIKL